MFEIKEVSTVEATADAFAMLASGFISVGSCVGGYYLLLAALAC